MDAVYVDHGREVVPTEYACGPWDPALQHGGAPAALLARAVEREIGGRDGQVVRLSVELMRPIPLAALAVSARTVRAGKKLRLVEAVLSVADVDVARAMAVWLRTTHLDLPAPAAETPTPVPPGPEAGHSPPPEVATSSGFFSGFETRVVAGDFRVAGPGLAWFRIRRPIVAGEEPTPLMRMAAVADFANGISSALDLDDWSFVNADLTVWCYRYASGGWIALDSQTALADTGIGCSHSSVFDTAGPIGWSAQSLLLDRRVT
jgi:Thioesterase-like superfamily